MGTGNPYTDRGGVVIRVSRTDSGRNLPLPSYATHGAAGLDLMAAVNEAAVLMPGQRRVIPTGLRIELPRGLEAQVRPRSGLAAKDGITVLNAPGTIDADYRGEIGVILINHGGAPFRVTPGMRIAQIVVVPVVRVHLHEGDSDLSQTSRGVCGFGSTGA